MTSPTALPVNPLAVSQRALPPLTRLDEYEIEQVLARSCFAVVYRARDPALKLQLAIKEYLPEALALRGIAGQVVPRSRAAAEHFEAGRQAFVAEAQTLARCVHPALLRVLRLVDVNGTVYRVMPYAHGVSLLEHRRERAAPPLPAVLCRWLDGLLGALAVLHGEGLVHGAVSPGKILRLADEQPLLLDFDAVRAALIGDGAQGMLSALEPCFAAPEQAASSPPRPIGPWTDLYSMAASLHFCVTGELPVAGGDGARLESLVGYWQRRHPGAAIPQDLRRLYESLDECLLEDPAQRPQSVAEFRERLAHGHKVSPAGAAAVAPAVEPPPATLPSPPAARPDPTAGAHIIAELDRTFADIAARAHLVTVPARPAAPAAPAAPVAPPMAADEAEPPADAAASADPVDAGTSGDAVDAGAMFARPAPRVAAWQVAAVVGVFALAIGAGAWWQHASERDRARPAPMAAAPAIVVAPPAAMPVAAPRAAVAMPATTALAPPLVYPPPGAGESVPPPPGAAVEPRVVAPKAAAPKPPHKKPVVHAKAALPASPADACAQRTQFALYRCMHTQCAQPKWHDHAQCQRLRRADALP